MSAVTSYFDKFLREIRPNDSQKNDLKTAHIKLRDNLNAYTTLSSTIVSMFLQGSYRRATALTTLDKKRADVDLIVVTNLNKDDYSNPEDAMNLFVPFLKEYYKGKYKKQGRSFAIELFCEDLDHDETCENYEEGLSHVDLDLVITAAPSEAAKEMFKSDAVTTDIAPVETGTEIIKRWYLNESWQPIDESNRMIYESMIKKASEEAEWKTEPLWIPDRDTKEWQKTNPLEQIVWTWGKNARCDTHYVNVVKAIKWWKILNNKAFEYPKGYPIEHIIGNNCPDNITSVAEGVVGTLENIVSNYSIYILTKQVPFLKDRGVEEHDVLKRIDFENFQKFYNCVSNAAKIARTAYDAVDIKSSVENWKLLFGDKFPSPPNNDNSGNGDGKGPFNSEPKPDIQVRKYG